MGSRKRARPNPLSEESAHNSSTTLPSQGRNDAGDQGRPSAKRQDSGATTNNNDNNDNNDSQVRKSRSWYGSWPRIPKSSASTSIARENIMGGSMRGGSASDLNRYDTKKAESTTDSDTLSTKTLPKISESETQPKSSGRSSSPTKPQDPRAPGADVGGAVGDGNVDGDEGSRIDGQASDPPKIQTSLEGTEGMSTSSGWLMSWFSRPTIPETATTPTQHANADPPKEPEVVPSEQLDQVLEPPSKPNPTPEEVPAARSTSSWFGLWPGSSAPVAQGDTERAKKEHTASDGDQDVTMQEPAAPTPQSLDTTQPSAGSTWAFWSRDDTGSKDKPQSVSVQESGELAVIGDGSEASPRRAAGVEVDQRPSSIKSAPVKVAKELSARASLSKRRKGTRQRSVEISESSPSRPSTPQTETVQSKPTTPTSIKTTPQNLLLPSFRNTYRLKENPSIIKQIAQLLLRTQQPSANHVFVAKELPKVKKAIAIGVHGLFPATYLRPMIGQPTGTSIRFAQHCAEAIRKWTDSHGYGDCEIEKVALEGEGKIGERVDNLWKLLLNWIEHIRKADLIMVACHSQGVPVSLMLLAKLIDLGIITNARIGVCAMAGVSLGPFPDYKSGMGILMGSAAELWQFADPESEVSQKYERALETVVNYGTRITYVGSIDDQLVPLESAVYSPASHPYIYRAVFIDGRIHAPDFIAHLVGFALKLRNLGISDHGLIRELSVPLAGSLYSGEGHSRLYDDPQVYDLAISHALETTSVAGIPCSIRRHEGLGNPNPYVLPWIMRGLLEEEFVKTELYSETAELLRQFDDWTPTTKALKDVKYRLEAVRSKL
ncbi:hypothetical protein F4780DRAFT_735299 [Xylariomycetidae sp. FL0641]|nr:hypothetical protein F4780DRAFT_735299 [Xylariomycetidae sp. FL0641]